MTGIDINLEQLLVKAGWSSSGDNQWHLPTGRTDPRGRWGGREPFSRDHAVLIEWGHDRADRDEKRYALHLSRQQAVTLIAAFRVLAITTLVFGALWVRSLLW